jgi:hypothetical protein
MDWDYDSAGNSPSSLATTEHFFRDFPWNGGEADDGEADGEADDGDILGAPHR